MAPSLSSLRLFRNRSNYFSAVISSRFTYMVFLRCDLPHSDETFVPRAQASEELVIYITSH